MSAERLHRSDGTAGGRRTRRRQLARERAFGVERFGVVVDGFALRSVVDRELDDASAEPFALAPSVEAVAPTALWAAMARPRIPVAPRLPTATMRRARHAGWGRRDRRGEGAGLAMWAPYECEVKRM